MPYEELLVHLASNGDAVASRHEGTLTTEHGLTYVRSREGLRLTSTGWEQKYLWVRWT